MSSVDILKAQLHLLKQNPPSTECSLHNNCCEVITQKMKPVYLSGRWISSMQTTFLLWFTCCVMNRNTLPPHSFSGRLQTLHVWTVGYSWLRRLINVCMWLVCMRVWFSTCVYGFMDDQKRPVVHSALSHPPPHRTSVWSSFRSTSGQCYWRRMNCQSWNM